MRKKRENTKIRRQPEPEGPALALCGRGYLWVAGRYSTHSAPPNRAPKEEGGGAAAKACSGLRPLFERSLTADSLTGHSLTEVHAWLLLHPAWSCWLHLDICCHHFLSSIILITLSRASADTSYLLFWKRATGIVLPSWKEADRPTPLRPIALFTLSGEPGPSQQPHQNRSSPAWSGVSSGGLNQSHFIFSVVHSVIKPVMKLLGVGATEPRRTCRREAPAFLKKCLPSSFTLYERAWAESRPR